MDEHRFDLYRQRRRRHVNVLTQGEFLGGVVLSRRGIDRRGHAERLEPEPLRGRCILYRIRRRRLVHAGAGRNRNHRANHHCRRDRIVRQRHGRNVSQWTLSDALTIGGGGVGTLLIKEGADVSGTAAYIGNGAGSSGSSVTVTGLGQAGSTRASFSSARLAIRRWKSASLRRCRTVMRSSVAIPHHRSRSVAAVRLDHWRLAHRRRPLRYVEF